MSRPNQPEHNLANESLTRVLCHCYTWLKSIERKEFAVQAPRMIMHAAGPTQMTANIAGCPSRAPAKIHRARHLSTMKAGTQVSNTTSDAQYVQQPKMKFSLVLTLGNVLHTGLPLCTAESVCSCTALSLC